VHVRDVTWVTEKLLDVQVPGAVARAFSRPGFTFSEIHDPVAREFSHRLFAELSGEPQQPLSLSWESIVSSLLHYSDVEDLVSVYLQATRGYIALPASRQPKTSTYEYTLIDPENGAKVIVQVKTGMAAIDLGDLAGATEKQGGTRGIAYAASGNYIGIDNSIDLLSTADLKRFAANRPQVLPPRVRSWFSWADGSFAGAADESH